MLVDRITRPGGAQDFDKLDSQPGKYSRPPERHILLKAQDDTPETREGRCPPASAMTVIALLYSAITSQDARVKQKKGDPSGPPFDSMMKVTLGWVRFHPDFHTPIHLTAIGCVIRRLRARLSVTARDDS